jgi:hypothetical protein
MMTSENAEDYVSIIGISYLYPITSLLQELNSLGRKGPNEVQASPLENGYSAAVIVLVVLLIESAINRSQYVRGEYPVKKPLAFVADVYPDSGLLEELRELFVVRDVIAHNHVWDTRFQWDTEKGMRLISARLTEGYGDRKFRHVLDGTGRRTRLLCINLFPTRICYKDVKTVLKVAVEFLLFLENKDRRYVVISVQPVKFDGGLVQFTDLVASL